MVYEKISKLLKDYLKEEKNIDETENFCNQYMDIFFEKSDELENEVPQSVFEILDDINLVCDSYEKNPEIRKDDLYCINENELREKINNLIKHFS